MTDTAAALLHAALQDLDAGKADQVERLPNIAERCGDVDLADLLRAEAGRAVAQRERIARAGVDVAGPRNL